MGYSQRSISLCRFRRVVSDLREGLRLVYAGGGPAKNRTCALLFVTPLPTYPVHMMKRTIAPTVQHEPHRTVHPTHKLMGAATRSKCSFSRPCHIILKISKPFPVMRFSCLPETRISESHMQARVTLEAFETQQHCIIVPYHAPVRFDRPTDRVRRRKGGRKIGIGRPPAVRFEQSTRAPHFQFAYGYTACRPVG